MSRPRGGQQQHLVVRLHGGYSASWEPEGESACNAGFPTGELADWIVGLASQFIGRRRRDHDLGGMGGARTHALIGYNPPQCGHLVVGNTVAQCGQVACVSNVSNAF